MHGTPARPALRLIQGGRNETGEDSVSSLPCCAGCATPMRPTGTTEAQYPETVPEWGDHQCQSCDYRSAGKDPENRFIDVERVAYLQDVRAEYVRYRRSRGIPADGLRRRNTLHLQTV